MNSISQKNPAQVTDKLAGLPPKVTDLTYDELRKAQDVYYSSALLHNIDNMLERMENGYKLNKFEIEGMEQLIKIYNIQYNSALAKVMSETKEEF